MKRDKLWLVLLVLLGIGFTNLEAKDFEWHTNFAKAQKLSTKEKLPILLFFTGSDWCYWCKKIDAEILEKSEFKKWAEKNVIPVVVDFPKDRSKHTKAAEALAKKYEVSGFPTLFLVKADGSVIAKTGYVQGGAANYVKHLETLLKKK